jgi:hypothetical protein
LKSEIISNIGEKSFKKEYELWLTYSKNYLQDLILK